MRKKKIHFTKLGNIITVYGEFLNGDFELSKRRFKKSLDLAKKINNDEERISAIKFIYRYYNKSFN